MTKYPWWNRKTEPKPETRPILDSIELVTVNEEMQMSKLVLKFEGRPPVTIARFHDDEFATETMNELKVAIYGE